MIFNLFICPPEELPYLKCPLHTVLKLTPVAYGKKLISLTHIVIHSCASAHHILVSSPKNEIWDQL